MLNVAGGKNVVVRVRTCMLSSVWASMEIRCAAALYGNASFGAIRSENRRKEPQDAMKKRKKTASHTPHPILPFASLNTRCYRVVENGSDKRSDKSVDLAPTLAGV